MIRILHYIEQLDYFVDRQIDECITYDEALEIFLNYISKSSQYEDFGLESIAFEYVVKTIYSSGEYDFTVVPCWRFSIDNHWLNDIVIEAENGSLSCVTNIYKNVTNMLQYLRRWQKDEKKVYYTKYYICNNVTHSLSADTKFNDY